MSAPHAPAEDFASKDDFPEDKPSPDYIAASVAKVSPAEAKRILRKLDLRVIPLLWLAYLIKNLDGNNVSYIKTMNPGEPTNVLVQLNMTSNDWAWTSTVFTIPFILGEVPSNLLFIRSTPRWHYIRIIGLWSIASACQAAAKNMTGLLVARGFLGLFEAGLYPGILLHLTFWYRPDELAMRLASIGLLGQFSGIFNALLAYGFTFISGKHLSGWQWMFLIEGIFGAILVILIYFFQPNYPEDAAFLTQEEREFVVARLPSRSAARKDDPVFDYQAFKAVLKSPTTYAFMAIQTFSNIASLGYSFWLPTIISNLGFTSTASSQLLNIPPAFAYLISGLATGYYLDHQTRIPRPVLVIVPTVITLGLFFGLAFCTTNAGLYTLIMLAAIAIAPIGTGYVPWRAQTLAGSTHAATTFAFQNCVGQLSGIFSPQIFRSQYAPRYTIPFVVCIVFWGATLVAIGATWYLTYDREVETRRIQRDKARSRKLGVEYDDIVQEAK